MESLVASGLVAVLAIIGIYVWRRKKAFLYWEKRGIPYIKDSFIYTVYRFYTKPFHQVLLEQYRKYGRIYGTFEFQKPSLTVCEPDLLRDILVKDFNLFNYRRDIPGHEEHQKMVTLLKGEDWKRVRTIITPAFTSKKMRQMSHIINECSKTVVKTLGKYADRGEPADCKNIFGAFSLDVIASAAFATKIDSLNDPENAFVTHAKSAFARIPLPRLLAHHFIPRWLAELLGLKLIKTDGFFKNTMIQVIKDRRQTGKKYDDMLQMLLQAQEENAEIEEDEMDQYGSVTHSGLTSRLKYRKLSEEEVIAQCILFFIVGYETTASTLCFMSYCLALNPKCQEKLIAEIDQAFEKHVEMNYDVIRDMKYLDLVLSEALRMYPPLSRSERTACADYKLGNTGLVVEKGTVVGFNIHAMHHDPEFFPDPEKFDPERFLPENANHPQYAYLPFGAGPRNCLGMRFAMMEIKLCICHVLRNYKMKKAPTTKVPLQFQSGQALLILDQLPLVVEKRNIKESVK